MSKSDVNPDGRGKQAASGRPAAGTDTMPPPVVQLESQGTAWPEPPEPEGSPGSAEGQGGDGKGALAGLWARLRRRPAGSDDEHYDFAAPGRMPSPDKLRVLPTSFRRTAISPELAANRSFLHQAFGGSWDIVYRDLAIGKLAKQAMLVYVDGLVAKEAVQRFAILALTIDVRLSGLGKPDSRRGLMEALQNKVIGFGELRLSADLAEIADRLVAGETALFVDGEEAAVVMDTRGWRDRGIQEPETEATVRGPREGFNETLKASTALLRRRLKTPLLRLERITIGDYTKTDVVVAYIEGLSNVEVVREVRRRLNRIVIDGILESQYIEEMIQDDPATFFPLVRATEYPDRVAAGMLEGKVAILTDTTPFVLTVPTTFVSLMHAAEDHFERPAVSTAIRLIRFLCLFIALFGSAIYVATTTFQPEILPFALLERLVITKRGVPFGSALEALILEVAFEILREAGVRLPRPVGQAVSIVGALVLGEAAVTAGLVSPAIVIVVALSAICSLALPSYFLSLGMRLLRFPLIILAGSLGIFGLTMAVTILVAHLVSLTSFGTPYLATVAPFDLGAWKRDVIIRAPRWAIDRRPRTLGSQVRRRAAPGQKPGPKQPNAPSADDEPEGPGGGGGSP